MPATMHTADEVRFLIRAAVKEAGTQRAFAAQVGVTAPYLCLVLSGQREPTDRILSAIGMRRIVAYTAI